MNRYRLETENDGSLGIYCSEPDLWIGGILEPESPNPLLALGTPLGILGVEAILDLFQQWKAGRRTAHGTRQPPPRASKCRAPTRKWRKALRDRTRG